MFQEQNCYLINRFVKQEDTYEKDFLCKFSIRTLKHFNQRYFTNRHLKLQLTDRAQKDIFLSFLFLPVFQVISAKRAWGKDVFLKV